MKESIKGLFDFIGACPTSYNACGQIAKIFEDMGCIRLEESKLWKIEAGKSYYVTRNNSSVIAFSVPETGYAPFNIIASHSDSPAFKVKDDFEMKTEGYAKVNTERYGGMIMSTWFDRPLSVAGRLLVSDESGISTKLVHIKDPVLVITNMPIHFNRNINDGYAYNAQVDTIPVMGLGDKAGRLMELAAENAGVSADSVIGHDLFVYCTETGKVIGSDGEFILCPRIDDLECAYASIRAFAAAKNDARIKMCCIFDNEEVGSGTKQGADSSFLTDVVGRIAASFGKTSEDIAVSITESFMLSADNGHAIHPNHPEKYDPTNKVRLNEGVVIKYNANQKYTSDGVSAAIFKTVCKNADVPFQLFHNRSDVIGGSTLGNISNTHLSLNTVDIGLAQLAMHSAVETAGSDDVDHMINAMTAFYDCKISCSGDGKYKVV